MAVSTRVIEWLRENDHDVLHVRDEGMRCAPDEDILTKARAEARVVLTLDLDFGYLLALVAQSYRPLSFFDWGMRLPML